MLMCIQVCMPNACQCKDGYVLEKDGLPSSENRCIKKENCVGSKSVEKMTKCQREAHDQYNHRIVLSVSLETLFQSVIKMGTMLNN